MIRKRRWLLITAAAVTCIAIAMSVPKMLPERPRMTEEQFGLICNGITRAEVESILGCKPGDYTSSKDCALPIWVGFFSQEQHNRQDTFEEWAADSPTPLVERANGIKRQDALAIRVWFDDEGKVVDKTLVHHEYPVSSTLSRISSWLRFSR